MRSARRVVVVSPPLDAAVLSLGASIARAARHGIRVEILTVFGGDPDSTRPTKGWDARAGFRTEGEAAQARRLEDAAACRLLGAAPVWLTFGSVDYERGGDESQVRDAVVDAFADTDVALVPGSPLTHPDHAWLVRVLTSSGELPVGRLGLYAEQPYTLRVGDARYALEIPPWLEGAIGTTIAFEHLRIGGREGLAKWRAIRRYRSQLPLLALSGARRPLERFLWAETRSGGEAVAWVPAGGRSARPRLPSGDLSASASARARRR
jgi:LmbE family N-acetylglucosaminyl deacetylase